MIIQIDPKIISYDRKMQGLCKTPFHGHPKGCPNFGKKDTCPPGLPLIKDVLDFDEEVYLAYTGFCVGEFAERMRKKHKEWRNHPRQWYNPRRWQPTARKQHREEINDFLEEHPELVRIGYPEAHGVNVSDLMSKVSIELDWSWPPEHILKDKKYLENFVYSVSLLGYKL